jgi:NAD(P)-dependent dehydrogenase (short-subunit alcohol dehydrogenase family)
MHRLDGKVAFITGAGGGIGRETATLFSREGAKVVIAERDMSAANETVEDICKAGGGAAAVEIDVTDADSVRRAIEAVVSRYGRINVLYNNVGGSSMNDGSVTDAPFDEFWRCIKVDLFGTWLCCHFGIPEIIRAGGGAVINTTSVLALVGTPGKDAYTAAKGAISALTRSIAVEYAQYKIRVNAIARGITQTNRVKHLLQHDGVTHALTKGYLLGLVEPTDVANIALYLASDESRVTTGQIVSVDSGVSIS